MRYQKLDQILLEMGLVDENILGKAKELQRESGGQLDEVLIRMKQITEGQALTAASETAGTFRLGSFRCRCRSRIVRFDSGTSGKAAGCSPGKEKRRYPVCRNEKSGRFYGA